MHHQDPTALPHAFFCRPAKLVTTELVGCRWLRGLDEPMGSVKAIEIGMVGEYLKRVYAEAGRRDIEDYLGVS